MGSALVNFEHVLATVVFWKSFWLHRKCLFLSDPDLTCDIKMQFVSNINLITAKKEADPALHYVNLVTSL